MKKDDKLLMQTMPESDCEMAWKYYVVLMTCFHLSSNLASKFADVKVDEVDSEDEKDGGDASDDDSGDDEVEEYTKDEEGRDEL